MENRLQAALAAALLTAASAASGEGLTEAQARTLIAPWEVASFITGQVVGVNGGKTAS